MLINRRSRESYQRGFYHKHGWEERADMATLFIVSNNRKSKNKHDHIDLIAFDADDTLWHTETLIFRCGKLKQVLSSYIDPAIVDEALFQTEMRNLPDYGYGIKASHCPKSRRPLI
jgi:hypothetical protein